MEFAQILDRYQVIVNIELEKFFKRRIDDANDYFLKESYIYLKEFVLRPGKRIRPIASIMSYKSIKDKNEECIYPISIAPELLHASSLVHDDIMDEDVLRRSKKTMHRTFEEYFKKKFKDKIYKGSIFGSHSKRFSVSMAIIQGNLLYSLSFSSVLESKLDDNAKNVALKILNDGYSKTNIGQMYDLNMATGIKADQKMYVSMAMGKTASPLSAAILLGAALNEASAFQLECLERYAMPVGLAFQIQDDIMDISESMAKGRHFGSDLKRGNKTLIVLKALQHGNKKQRRDIYAVLGNGMATDSQIEKAKRAVGESGSLDYAYDYAKNCINEAKLHLKKANLSKEGYRFFSRFADYMADRKA